KSSSLPQQMFVADYGQSGFFQALLNKLGRRSMRIVQHVFVDLLDGASVLLDTEEVSNPFATLSAHLTGTTGIAKKRQHRTSQGSFISNRNQESGFAAQHNFGYAAGICRDHRLARRHSFDDYLAKGLANGGGVHDHLETGDG